MEPLDYYCAVIGSLFVIFCTLWGIMWVHNLIFSKILCHYNLAKAFYAFFYDRAKQRRTEG
jgi:hypothetical protein